MLNIIRDNVQSFSVKFVVAIVAVVMLTFGLSTYSSQGINTVVEVDGYEIKVEDYQRAYERAESQYREQYRDNAEQIMQLYRVKEQVVEQLINSAVLLQNARENGLEVSDLELANAIYENPSFQTDYRFDPKKYNRMLESYRTDKIAYENDMRESLLAQKYIDFLSSGVIFSRNYIESEYKRFQTRMDIDMIELKPGLLADRVEVTEKQARDYYDIHKANFERKKQLALDYILLSPDDVKERVIVREREIERYYENHRKSDYTVKESYSSRHILIAIEGEKGEEEERKAKEQADRIYEELRKEKSKFAQLAAKYSDDPGSQQKGGDLGWVEKGTFVQPFEQAIGSLKKGEISKPVKSPFGYHIIELIDKKDAAAKSLEEVREEIAALIRLGKAQRRLANKAAKLLQVEEGQSRPKMQELAESLDKTVEQTDPFDDRQNLEKLGYSQDIYTALNSKLLGDRGSFELADDKGILIYEISKIIDSFIQPFEAVENQVKIFAKLEAEKEFAKQKGEEFLKSVTTKEQFEELAKSLKTEIVNLKFRLADDSAAVGNINFREKVHTMAVGEIKLIARDQYDALVFLNAKAVPNDGSEKNGIKALETQLRRQKASILLNGIIANARLKADIQYRSAVMEALGIAQIS